jgi:hypothetical protein
MIKKCKWCDEEFENGFKQNDKGHIINRGREYCSERCLKRSLSLKSMEAREKLWFEGKRQDVLKRDKYSCQICGRKESLAVHHKNGRGRGNKKPDNRIENLITVCHSCHQKIHCTKHHLWTDETYKKFVSVKHLSNRAIARILNITHPTVAKMRVVFNDVEMGHGAVPSICLALSLTIQ